MIGYIISFTIGSFFGMFIMALASIAKQSDKCDKCGKIPANIKYKDKKYCTWYCAKK